ncbi:MAG: Hpt domain-containing protein [Hyphomonadaceae bacterium]|nr:Hpt domain-containing protein [Hyphomonadaceae bacterium]MBP9235751.1 Hpt domain-containing protein [Hyphomonadaceae bacterium]
MDVVDVELVRFESCTDDKATRNNIFLLLHSIKGACGFIGLPRLDALAHAGETLLGKFRDGALDVTSGRRNDLHYQDPADTCYYLRAHCRRR